MIIDRKSQLLSGIIINFIFILFCLLCLIPFIAVISISFSSEASIGAHGYSLIPREFSNLAYTFILKTPKAILSAYWVTIRVCIIGTFLSLLVMSLCAYPLSRYDFKYRSKISFYIFLTMLFNGGLVPTYIWIAKYLQLSDTFWVLFMPVLVSPWYLILMRTFFSNIPSSIIESATVDGASEFRIYYSMILPLAKPALATIGLFTVLGFWNDWFRGLLYIENPSLVSLQYMLYKMMANIQELQNAMVNNVGLDFKMQDLPNESARMAMCVIAAGPMIFIFPFFQKYFIKGLTVGSVKG